MTLGANCIAVSWSPLNAVVYVDLASFELRAHTTLCPCASGGRKAKRLGAYPAAQSNDMRRERWSRHGNGACARRLTELVGGRGCVRLLGPNARPTKSRLKRGWSRAAAPSDIVPHVMCR